MLGQRAVVRTLCVVPLSHAHGSETLALPTLLAGGTLFLKSPKFAFPLYILEEIAQLRISFFSSVPAFYDAAVKLSLTQPPDLATLRLAACGTAPLARSTAQEFHARLRRGYPTDLPARGAARDLHESSRRRGDERRLHVDRWTAGPWGTDA